MPAHQADTTKTLSVVLRTMTRGFDWNTQFEVQNPCSLSVEVPFGVFHVHLTSPAHKIVDHVLSVSSDQDRLHFAEQFAEAVLEMPDQNDQKWFRRGVWIKETLPTTRYPEQRDHAVHTMHNYLLGWYLFAVSPAIRLQLIEAFKLRRIIPSNTTSGYNNEIINRFGEIWIFASLLHDVGYLFEGEVASASMTLLDENIREGARWASEYFEEVFWGEIGTRNVNERNTLERMSRTVPTVLREGGAGTVAQFLRDLGSLEVLERRLEAEAPGAAYRVLPLGADAFELWAKNYRAFDQGSMAQRMEILERALYDLIELGMAKYGTRVFDHGICGGLLLLKGSTYWFRFKFGLDEAHPPMGSAEAKLKDRVQRIFHAKLHAEHWWKSVVWATAAVAIHNVQQLRYRDEWGIKSKLKLTEDPLAYLGILVDILQEWDRHSARRIQKIGVGPRRINSGDVSIGPAEDGRIAIRYGCRDNNWQKRWDKMNEDLDDALEGWRDLVEISFFEI